MPNEDLSRSIIVRQEKPNDDENSKFLKPYESIENIELQNRLKKENNNDNDTDKYGSNDSRHRS